MAELLTVDNFKAEGRFHLSINSNNEKALEAYIVDVQSHILNRLLGCELAKLFLADLNNETPPQPNTQIYKDIYDPPGHSESPRYHPHLCQSHG